jgi:hypothetical protein
MTACIAVIAFNCDRVGFTDDVTLRGQDFRERIIALFILFYILCIY